jgi:hypothetical protein
MSNGDAIQRAVALAKAGRRDQAHQILRQVLQKDTDNVSAWVAMAQLSRTRVEAIYCLQQVLRLRPDNPWATTHIRRLSSLEAQGTPPPERLVEEATVPSFEEEADQEDDLFSNPAFLETSDDFPFGAPPTVDVESGQQDVFLDPFADISSGGETPRRETPTKRNWLRMVLLAGLLLVVVAAMAVWGLGLFPR